MGAGITTQVQVLEDGEWISFNKEIFECYGEPSDQPFSEQNYGLFGFLANVRNYAMIPVLKEPCGLPEVDEPDFGDDLGAAFASQDYHPWPNHQFNHSASWYLVSELLDYDYDTQFENRRSNGETLPVGSGEMTTVKEYIGPKFFRDLAILKDLGDPSCIRILISFDS